MKYIITLASLTSLLILLPSCSSGPVTPSPVPTAATTPRNGKAVVIVYRTPGMMGMLSKPFVWVNDQKMPGQLARGGFYSYESAPGAVKIVYSWRDHRPTAGENIGGAIVGGAVGVGMNYLGHEKIDLNLQVLPNQTRYVLMDGTNLSEVSQEEGKQAVAECQWLNPGS
jgi:hypothetical protein